MAKPIANVNTVTETFQNWVDKTNQTLDLLSKVVVTVAPSTLLQDTSGTAPLNANAESTVGYAHVNGYFSTDNLIAKTALRGGNTSSYGNLNIVSNTFIVCDTSSITANLYVQGANLYINTTSTTIVGTSVTVNAATNINGNVVITANSTTVSGNTNFDAGTLFVDSVNNRVGVNKTNPTVPLDIVGAISATGNLIIGGTASITGNVTATGTSHVLGGNTAITGNMTASGNLGGVNLTLTGNTIGVSAAMTGNVSAAAVNANVFSASDYLIVSSANASLGSNISAPQLVFSYHRTQFNTAKVVVQLKNGVDFHSQEIFLINNATDVNQTVYATLTLPGSTLLGTFSSTVNTSANTVELFVQQATAATSAKVFATLIRT